MGGEQGRRTAEAGMDVPAMPENPARLSPHPALPLKGGGFPRGRPAEYGRAHRPSMPRLATALAIVTLAALPRPAIADDDEGHARVEVLKTPDGGIQPQAVADGRGTVHLLFFRGDPSHGDLFYAKRNPGQTGGFLLPIRVNSEPGSAIATGTIRGGQIALGPKGKVHVAWNGSTATPSAPAPMWYSRIKPTEDGFEPQRSLMKLTTALDGGGTVAADDQGRVFVAWHARGVNDPPGEDPPEALGRPLRGRGRHLRRRAPRPRPRRPAPAPAAGPAPWPTPTATSRSSSDRPRTASSAT